jgi:patatin-like phospholipase/acyl hydrolase
LSDAPFRVLALDGGGIRGVLPAVLLGELESRAGHPTAQLFDLIVGTSTGGILALALSAPRAGSPFTPADLIQLYETQGQRIFAPWPRSDAGRVVEDILEKALHLDTSDTTPGRPLPWTRAILHPKFTATGIEGALQQVLGQANLGDVTSTRVAVTSYDLDARSLHLYRSWEAATTPAANLPIWQAARATSAAPVFFPPATVTCADGSTLHCVDGGVCVNDPAVLAIAEGRRLLRELEQADRELVVVSVGTGAPPPSTLPFALVQDAGLLDWVKHGLLDVIMGSGAFAANFELGELLGADQHFRLQPATSGPGYAADPAMDDVSAANLAQLVAAGQAFIAANGALFDRLARLLPSKA